MAAGKTTPKGGGGGGGVFAARLKRKTELPPGTLGFSHLLKPDDKFGDPKFQALIHYNEQAHDALIKKVEAAIPELMALLAKEVPESKAKTLKAPDAADYITDRTKEPTESMSRWTDLPFIAFSAKYKEGVSKKTGQPWKIEMRAWDRTNTLLDLRKLKLGRGSIVSPIVTLGIFISPLVKQPMVTIRLEGLRIIKLEQFQGSSAPDEFNEADLALINDTDLDDDLSQFAASASGPVEGTGEDSTVTAEDDVDNLPF